jgi:ribonucleotide monophosphatase NagD (HAD superfamily)
MELQSSRDVSWIELVRVKQELSLVLSNSISMSSRVLNNFLEGLGGLIWKGSIIASGLVAIGLGEKRFTIGFTLFLIGII